MELLKKIKWKRGMEITPSTFEDSDRYWETADIHIRRLAVLRSFGLTPWTSKNVCVTLSDGQVNVDVVQLEAVSRSGVLMRIADSKVAVKEPRDKGSECYLVVIADREVEKQIDSTTYIVPAYTYEFRTLGEIGDDAVSIAKLKNEHNVWHIQELYIPPCTTLNADPELMRIADATNAHVTSICNQIANTVEPFAAVLLKMQALRFTDLDMSEPPSVLHKLMADIAMILSNIVINGREMPVFDGVKAYNHNDILNSIMPLSLYLEAYDNMLKSAPEPEPAKKTEQPVDVYYEL